jgi:hypothetical protein
MRRGVVLDCRIPAGVLSNSPAPRLLVESAAMRSLREKKQDFLRKKANEIYASLIHTNEPVEGLYDEVSGPGLQMPGFVTARVENRFSHRKDYAFFSVKNERGNGLNLEFYTRVFRGFLPEKRLAVNFDIFSIQWGWHIYKAGFLPLFLSRLADIEREYLEYSLRAEKEEKIAELCRNSITVWLEAIFKDGPYAWRTEKDDDKIRLQVTLKDRRVIETPVYHENFQETLPGLLDRIHRLEEEGTWE